MKRVQGHQHVQFLVPIGLTTKSQARCGIISKLPTGEFRTSTGLQFNLFAEKEFDLSNVLEEQLKDRVLATIPTQTSTGKQKDRSIRVSVCIKKAPSIQIATLHFALHISVSELSGQNHEK